jgi:hypothetical protein
MNKLLLACALFSLTSLSAVASDNPFASTWKLDLLKSHFTGDTFTYTTAANGMMHYTDGSTTSFDFGIDGKEYPTADGRTATWTPDGDHAWKSVIKFNGKVLATSRRELSADGKTLTIVSTGTRPDGSPFKEELVYTRVTGTSGLAGKWRNTKYNQDEPDSLIIAFPTPDTVRWEIPAYKETITGKTDGSDLPITGPNMPKTLTVSIKMDSSHKLSYTVKREGKPFIYGIDTISSDGKTLTDVSWTAGKESEKQTGIYIKQ